MLMLHYKSPICISAAMKLRRYMPSIARHPNSELFVIDRKRLVESIIRDLWQSSQKRDITVQIVFDHQHFKEGVHNRTL